MKLLYFICCLSFSVFGQEVVKNDSSFAKNLDEVVVTATRNERQMGALPMPVSVVSKKQIQQMGSLRLNDVLAEQTGLFIVNNHGNGVQVQGFNPDYTLILVDGEPLVGRTSGTLELSRLAVGNIKQIEIVKGPSSSLYGSEALAGVINIITENPDKTNASLSARYGANQTSDISLNGSFRKNKIGFSIFGNRFSSGGYDLNADTYGQTVTPFYNYTIQPKLNVFFSEKTKLTISSRYFTESQTNDFNLGTNDKLNVVSGNGSVRDFSLNPSFTHKFSDKLKLTTRFYTTRYQTKSLLKYETDGKIYDETYFIQNFQRPEIQADFVLNQKNLLTTGVGIVAESVEATRYDELKKFSTKYVFAQYEYLPSNKLHFIIGSRYDAHSDYRNQISPKISGSYELSPKITLRASAGVGYKAPDFRQLYLNFTNAVAGYSVFGSQEIVSNLARLQAEKQITDLLIDPNTFGELRPESSFAYNFGGKYTDKQGFKASVNFFRNDIRDLIETQVVARKTNGQNVFSYRNLSEVFTQGLELETNKQSSI
ncbi:MAG: TonB-dependent receptor [Emticicia sp.]|nr:TonB-dependent receptor [Emticicia sp.]